MKVSTTDFESHLVLFLKKIVETFQDTPSKWLGGAAIAMNAGKIDHFVKSQADVDGLIDLDKMRGLVKGGFNASGGEVAIPFNAEGLSLFGIHPMTIKLTQADAEEFFRGFGV